MNLPKVIAASFVLYALIASPCLAQNTVDQLLNGSSATPATVRLGDLNSTWMVFELGQGASTGYAGIISALYGGGASQDYFTQGVTVMSGSDEYLVAYQPKQQPFDLTTMMSSGRPPAVAKLTADSLLTLSLINLHSVSVLSNYHKFDLQSELASSASAAQVMNNLITPGAPQEAAGQDTSLSRLKQLDLAMLQYVNDHDEKFPKMDSSDRIKSELSPYASTENIFVEPGTNTPFAANASLSGKSMSSLTDPASEVAFYEPTADSDGGRYVAYADGHVKKASASDWTALKKTLNGQ